LDCTSRRPDRYPAGAMLLLLLLLLAGLAVVAV
jgi:hypothetical protein